MLMKIHRATRLYEAWLAKQIHLVPIDLALKHKTMKRDAFLFFRSTFYLWMQVWPEVCRDVVTAPLLLAIGDAHVENFGTWRDSEGRLIWGINDFDEAYPLPYTNDLVRLAVSATLAIDTKQLAIKPKVACDALLTGYTEGLNSGGRPFVLAEEHWWLRDIATNALRDPVKFWENMEALPPVKGAVPHSVRVALDHLMPGSGLSYRLKRRVSGLGSLGPRGSSRWPIGKGGRLPVRRKPWGSQPVCGQERTMDPTLSFISLYWTRLFGAMILLCGYRVAGLYDGSPPPARALNWPHCRGNEMKPISRWAGRRPTCIWEPTRRSGRFSETSQHESPNG